MLAAALLGGAVAGWWGDRLDPATPVPAGDVTAASGLPVQPGPTIRAVRDGTAPGPPVALRVPGLGLELPVRPQGVAEDGAMALPASVGVAGWYRYGARPGATAGAAVIAGHVDTVREGVGPLSRLVDLRPGDQVSVVTTRGVVEYAVASVTEVPRDELDLDRLFARGGPARLHLVTCGGAYLPEAGGYQANVVVVGVPVGDDRAGSGIS